jgi:hypothetical protein
LEAEMTEWTLWTPEVLREAEEIIEEAGPQSEAGCAAELAEWGGDG